MFIAVRFAIAKLWGKKCLLVDESIKEPLCACTMECFSAFTEKEILPLAMNLEDIVLSEISQAQKEEYTISLACQLQKKIIIKESNT